MIAPALVPSDFAIMSNRCQSLSGIRMFRAGVGPGSNRGRVGVASTPFVGRSGVGCASAVGLLGGPFRSCCDTLNWSLFRLGAGMFVYRLCKSLNL